MRKSLLRLFLLSSAFAVPSFAVAAPVAPPLVDITWLRHHLHDADLVILDVYDTADNSLFSAGHIPGAEFTNFHGDGWLAKVGSAPGMLPSPDEAAKVIGRFGISNKSRVILVPGGRAHADFPATTRIYWTFRALGDDNVSILNGGDKAWFANPSTPIATGITKAQPKTFVAHFRPDYLATRADVEEVLKTHSAQLVDARPPAQYEGKVKSPAVRVAGTLPGAINVPAQALVSADGTRLRDKAALDAILAKAGLKAGAKQISFCNTGHLASGTWFVLREIEGNPNVKLYAGSMSDWTSDIKLPVVNGPTRS